ncbi:MAG: polar amino acid transport system substrate-binding protein [Halioglobus sp.]|jgi:ABC-type amino acid transport substrate-binding protein
MSNVLKRFLLAGLLTISAVFSTATIAGDTLQRVVDFQVLKVGMSLNQPPFNAISKSGQAMGFDVDLARALAAAMQVKLDIKAMPFGELIAALEDEKIDMIISGMEITPERTENVSFVGPYMMSGKSILTKNSVLAKIRSSEDFDRKELKLVALQGSTSATFVTRVAPSATLVEVSDYDIAVAMILEDKADAMVADLPICALSVMRYPEAGMTTLSEPLTIAPVGIAISKDDPQFLNLVENYLDAYGKVGLLTKMRKKWFEDKAWIASLP